MRPLAVIGNLSRDIVGGRPPRVGGAPFHAGRALRLLGREARLVTRCAIEDRAALLPPLVALGLPVSWRASKATAGFSFHYRGDSREMTIDAVGDAWSVEEATGWAGDALGGAVWVHVAPLVRSDFPTATVAALARGRRLLLDGQGLVRAPRPGPLQLDADFDPEVLRHVTVLKLSEEEADVLGGSEVLPELGVREVVVTLGSRGALVWADGRSAHVATRAAVPEPDPTGAGDAFCAAYLTARNAGSGPTAAARRACALVGALLARPRR